MTAESRRAALLASPGLACDRLREVLGLAGLECVLEGDPLDLDPATLTEAAPKVVLVALDPSTEDALDRFDAVLFDSDVEVIYEEAELAGNRDGWEVARWQRHLIAKLQRHGDVLPAGTEPGEMEAPASVEVVVTADVAPTVPTEQPEQPEGLNLSDQFDPVLAEITDVPVAAPAPDRAGVNDRPAELSLDDGSVALEVASESTIKDRFQRDLGDLERRISGLELVDDTPVKGAEQARGAVLVLAGLGGPDAVRQLLGGIAEGFPRPILVQQHLAGARYDKLVAQMQRATALPVRLAEPGQFAHAGIVYILPDSIGVDVSDSGIRFNQEGDLIASMPSSDSAILLLSGSDASQVDAVLNHGWAGALVAGQAADGCYDADASNALAARGGDVASPAELAVKLSRRWPS
ncbi:chemotaxis protein CheB [Lysobacter sp. A289]